MLDTDDAAPDPAALCAITVIWYVVSELNPASVHSDTVAVLVDTARLFCSTVTVYDSAPVTSSQSALSTDDSCLVTARFAGAEGTV